MDNEDIFKDLPLDKTRINFSDNKESLTIFLDDKWQMYFRADFLNETVSKEKSNLLSELREVLEKYK